MSKQARDLARTEKAAAIRADQARKERNKRVAMIAGIVVLLGAVIAGGTWYGSSGGKATTGSTTAAVTAGATSVLVGKPSAPVKVVIYEDFQCPYCRELESSTRDFLRENAAKGKVYVEYQPINLLSQLPYSGKALNAWAAVLEHGSPQAALKLHDLFYDHQPYEQDSANVTDSQISGWVKEAGGDNAAVRTAMGAKDDAFFAAVDQLMATAHIQSTPTIVVDGKQLPGASVPDLVSELEDAVDQGS
ncbi:MAG: thioredoxin domain-containing protein [Propionibacteriales bacterium]|nr:thioredoxin domain-containing protein [Propionibacteriales bacterium]